jgi:DnaJ-class molecular chaperone
MNMQCYICDNCQGSGYELVMGVEKCPPCLGTGRDPKSDLWSEICRFCNGSGSRSYCRRDSRYVCHTCGGRGRLYR